MKKVRLGRSDLLVSPIAFGAWELGGDWGATDEADAIATIRHAANSGINFFDTPAGRRRNQRVVASSADWGRDDRRRQVATIT